MSGQKHPCHWTKSFPEQIINIKKDNPCFKNDITVVFIKNGTSTWVEKGVDDI